jgi:transcriptional regulator with XRE-family HTH domain
MKDGQENALGVYLRDRRTRLDPRSLGLPMMRRRTAGLRREEVAQRANVSATWYTWLEQGRGGAPSSSVLERVAHALMLTEVEREHLFLLALGRPPDPHYRASSNITPRLQRILDALKYSPAFVRTATWDVIAWNDAATALFGDYGAADAQRNILRRMFTHRGILAPQKDWENFVVATFRAEALRAGASANIKALVEELCAESPEFKAIWQDNDVRTHGEGTKELHHPTAGKITVDYSAFSVDGRPDLSLVIYSPVTDSDTQLIRSLVEPTTKRSKARRS